MTSREEIGNPERWERVKGLFHAALERDPGQRTAFLQESCGGDPSLRAEVEELLASHEQTDGPIEPFAVGRLMEKLAETHTEPMTGQRIGSYQIIRPLGRGGMGAVYLAVRADDQYQKRVTIKLVKRGMDSEEIRRRFRQERQILASLDHPNIAKLFDGGTTDDGLPYFVMEYIEGTGIDPYCNNHSLSIAERLALFRTVCAAVHYAHQNLIVHRDLKPSNVLVTVDGTVKLLDFGIAKLLNPELSADGINPTRLDVAPMTPEYASPEQVRGEPMTTASDVYSLGVLLYELLTGCRPYTITSNSPLEITRVICEQQPKKPSTASSRTAATSGREPGTAGDGQRAAERLRRQLRGDLDNIVLMALRKEPRRRYASVEQFSEDIRRHLDGLPVVAQKATFSYRAQKFVKRHKAGVAAAALVAATLVGGMIAVARQARLAETERAKAELRFNEVRKLANSLVFQLHDQIAELPGSTPAREALVKMALEYLDRLAQSSGAEPSLQQELALAYQKVGDVQGNPTNANLGDTAGALASYRKALAIAQALAASRPDDSQARRSLALMFEKTSDLQAWTGNVTTGVESVRKSLAIFETLAEADSANLRARQSLAISRIKLGDILGNPNLPNAGHRAEALAHYRQSLTIWQALAATDSTNATTSRYLGLIHERIGTIQQADGKLEEALNSYRQSLDFRDAFSARNPTNTNARRDMAIGYEKVADVLVVTEDPKTALEHYRKALGIFEALSAADPHNANASRSLAIICEKIGRALLKSKETTDGLEFYRRSLALREALSAADRTNVQDSHELAGSYSKLGDLYAEIAATTSGDRRPCRDAKEWYQRSLDIWGDLRTRNLLKGGDALEIERIAKAVAHCDRAPGTLK